MQAAVGPIHSTMTQPSTVSGVTKSTRPPVLLWGQPVGPGASEVLFASLHNHCGQGNNAAESIFHWSAGARLNSVHSLSPRLAQTLLFSLPESVGMACLSELRWVHTVDMSLLFLFRQATNEQHPYFCHRTLWPVLLPVLPEPLPPPTVLWVCRQDKPK